MGLDGVELIMAVEESFGIQIADEEAGALLTVGDLHNLVLAKLHGQSPDRCLTSVAFYRLRRAFMDGLRVNRRDISPGSLLGRIIPREGRRQQWERVNSALHLKMPELERPRWVWLCLSVFALALSAALTPAMYAMSRRYTPNTDLLVLVVLAGFVFFVSLGFRLSRPLANAFPSGIETAGDLAREVLSRNHAQLAAEVGSYNTEEVWDSVCRLIVNQTGVEREKVRPEARIVKDLGVD